MKDLPRVFHLSRADVKKKVHPRAREEGKKGEVLVSACYSLVLLATSFLMGRVCRCMMNR